MSPQSGMSAQLSEVRGGDTLAVPFGRPRVRPSKVLQYELNVVAVDAADTVASIGGWLFDRAMAGWQVNVAVEEGGDGSALRILGLKAVGLNALWRSVESDSVAITAIGTSRVESGDHGLTLRDPVGDVVFFGSRAPDGFEGQIQRVQYCPTAAALAFKAHALAIAGADPGLTGGVETLFRCGRSSDLLDADLVPVC
ncbi:hypothetical protein VST63_05230 [Mycolicibacterium sp. 050232]|uniref:hypothetical protein n=1 Tax=Mycolicibacterium sp. 050232 TaxID=3113982 RepID=UPI002E27D85B|nr:hypothetical protein [Mycolicibacterium sp. 050232]MED5811756.1 hypothetical protein [Mycolicibacterium sp. 050232]